MSRGVADNTHSDDANLPSNSSPSASQSPTDASADASSPHSPSASNNNNTLVTQNAQTPETTTNAVNGNAADGNLQQQQQQSIELNERSPSPQLEDIPNYANEEMEFIMNGGDDRSGQSSSGSQESVEVFDPDLRRVKLYELVGSRWTDRGTAFCCGEFDSELDEARLIVKAEGTHQEILSCRVRAQDVYQRQQQTLIVWTEPNGADFALSFQDQEGCAEVWEFITEVQRHLNSRAMPNTAAQIISSGHLPPPGGDATFIGEIEKAIRTMARSPKSRETICFYIQENRYVYQMVTAFEAAEKTENLEALHALCSCMQTILLLNEHTMYEHILADDLWLGVVGMLEYDPEFPKFKANYREFLLQRSQFVQPVVIKNDEIQRKIHATYRLQYLKDVILGRALDDSTFSVLNSCIIFNQIDIINHIQRDEHFLAELVSYFIHPAGAKGKEKEKGGNMEVDKPPGDSPAVNGVVSPSPGPSSSQANQVDDNADVDRKKEIVALLQQLCVMGKNVQLPTRIALFRTLVERGVLYAVQWALCRPERHIISTAGEILSVLLDHHSQSVRNHILTQAVTLGQPTNGTENGVSPEHAKIPDVTNGGPAPFKETLSQVLCRMMANSQDLAVQTQIADALRLLVDTPPEPPVPPPETPQAQGQPGAGPVANQYFNRPIRDEVNTERFLDNFYKVCIETLMRPLTHDVPDHHELKNAPFTPSRERGNVYLYLCDLLCSFATQHSFRSYFFVIKSNVVSRVASLLSVRDKHLCLAALRFFRICLKMNNRNLFMHMQKHEVFTPICSLTTREARRENLLSSTCQEFFEFMRKENLRDPIGYIMDKHEVVIRELAKTAKGSATFQNFISRWEINKEPPPPEVEKRPSIIVPPRIFGQRVMESEEDDSYFNSDENEDDPVVPVPRVDSFLGGLFRRKRQRISAPGPHVQINKVQRLMSVPSQNRPVSPLSSLLEYEDDEDAASPSSEQIQTEKEPSTPQSPVLTHRQIQILPYDPSQDEPSDPEDDLLESLVSKEAVGQPSLPSKPPPAKLAEKRRRGDDEDDALERLTPKNRRLSNASDEASKAAAAKARASAGAPSTEGANANKAGDEGQGQNQGSGPGQRKLRVKISVSKNAGQAKLAPAPPAVSASSKSDSKDDGNG